MTTTKTTEADDYNYGHLVPTKGISFQLPLKIKENGLALLLEAFLDILLPKILSSFTKYIFDTFFSQDYDNFFIVGDRILYKF